MLNIRKLESELWESADLLRAGSKLTSNQYCMPVLGLIFLRYAYSRFKLVEAEIMKDRPMRRGRALPVEASDFASKSALFLPREAQYEYLLNLPDDIAGAELYDAEGNHLKTLGEVVNNAMALVEAQSEQLTGVLPNNYTMFRDDLLQELLRIFSNSALDEVDGDVIGRIYEYFLNKFAKNIAQDDGVFFTPKSLVKMIVNVLEPKGGVLLDPACGSGGMFVQTGDFVNAAGMEANCAMTFYGQEKVEYNAKLCLMNMAVHGLNGIVKSGDEANTFYFDAHNLDGCCDYIMANPPFNVDKVKSEQTQSAGRLPFGLPSINKNKEFGNGNYLWISYFYSYLNEKGRAGFVMASSATDSSGKDRDIREKLVKTGHVDMMMSVGNNFFYTKSLPCSLWFFDKGKVEAIRDKVLFIDARNYYTVVDRTLNEWSEWQLKNLNAIVWLHRGNRCKYDMLVDEYEHETHCAICDLRESKLSQLAEFYRDELVWSSLEDAEQKEFRRLCDIFQTWFTNVKWFELLRDRSGLTVIQQAKKDLAAFEKMMTDHVGKLAFRSTVSFWSYDDEYDVPNLSRQATKAQKKRLVQTLIRNALVKATNYLARLSDTVESYFWLTEKFGEGEYRDIPGLCKAATLAEIEEKNYSLTPGAYVGVAEQEDDGVDFSQRMQAIHRELLRLQTESNELMQTISRNMEGLNL